MNKIIKNTIIAFQALLLLSAFKARLMAQSINVDNIKINVGTGYYISTAGSMQIQNSGAIDNSGTLKIASNWTNNANGLINASAGTVELNGATQQTIGGSAVTIFNNLIINNSNGVTLAGNIIVNGILTFTNGKITTGANYVILGNSATVTGAGAGKYVNGNLRRFIPATANAVVNFQIGDATNYTPVQLTFVGTPSGASSIDAATSVAAPPLASGISQTQYVNRQWNLTNNGVTGFTSYNAIFNFAALDIIGGANTANFIVANFNTPNWSLPTVGDKTSTSTEITGATGFGTFALGVANDITWYLDADNDGYYVSTTQSVSSPGAGYTSTLPANGLGDCNDNDVNVFALPTAQTITASGATTFCAGGSVTLSGNNGGVWSTGATSATIDVIANGDYYVTNANSCGSVESNHILVNVNQNPSPVITGGASFCTNNSATLNAGSGFTSYLWNNGSAAQNFLITQPGSYSVTVTNASNCSAFASIVISPCASAVPETRLRSIDCGKINLIPSAQIACNIVSGASNYEWEFRSISTNAVYATKITSSYIISPGIVTPTLQWNTQYNCRVRAKVGGVWGNFGTSCLIGLMQNPAITGVPATTIRPQFCNVTNLALTTTIACQSVSMWSLYQYEFTDVSTNQVITKQLASIYLVLNTVSPALLPGHTYQVKVRGYVYNTWSAWSAACSMGISSGISAREISISTDAEGNETIVENEITLDASINQSIFNLSVYPNPFNQQATLFIQSSKSDKAQVQIFDMVGNLVWNEQINTNTNVSIGNDFATGTYIVKVLNENGEQAIQRMIKTN